MMNAKNILSIIAGALALAACSGPQEENLRMVPLTVPATVPMTSYGPHARVVVAGIDYTEVHDEWMNPDIMKKATPGNTRVVISRGRQRGQLMVGDEVAMDFPVCVGKASHRTPVGHFRITEKAVHHVSNLFHAADGQRNWDARRPCFPDAAVPWVHPHDPLFLRAAFQNR